MKHFIHTSTGSPFFYGETCPLSVEDVAHHLSGVSRFSGATKWVYSVGQHSLLVEQLVALVYPQAPLVTRRHALMHDAHEAVMGDIPTPFQRWFAEEYCDGDDIIERAKARLDFQIMPAFGIFWPQPSRSAAIVRACDKYAFVIEARQLFHDIPTWLDDYVNDNGLEAFHGIDFKINHMLRSEVRESFLSRWSELSHDEDDDVRHAS